MSTLAQIGKVESGSQIRSSRVTAELGSKSPFDLLASAADVHAVQRGKACGAEEFDAGQIQDQAIDVGGVAQRVVDELLRVGRVEFAVCGDHRH